MGAVIAARPKTDVTVPAAVAAVTDGRVVQPVWQNELGGLTFEIGADDERCFVKWVPHTSGINLSAEVLRLQWAASFTPVPQVLAEDADQHGSWIVTAPVPGDSAVSDRWTQDPARAVAAIGHGLRAFHDRLPVATCPFSWSAADRVASAQDRAAALDPARWHPDHQSLSIPRALRILEDAPPIDRLVVCHGDACAPNTLLTTDGLWSGHVDLGHLGVADRWADLAIATWSTEWNYGPGWEIHLLTAYGVTPDPDRTAYYRLLWDLGP